MLAGCVTTTGPPASTPVAESHFSTDAAYDLGETVAFESGVLVTVRDAGKGPATDTAVGAQENENIEAFNVYVENHSEHTLSLSSATLDLQYRLAGTTYAAPAVADLDNSVLGSATGSLPTPVPVGKASNGAWLFAAPSPNDGMILKLDLGGTFSPIIFQN